jgi:hypothetical protein
VKLGAGLAQLKLVSSGAGEGEEGVNAVEYKEGEEEDVQTEHCCRVTTSADSNAGLGTLLRVGGRNGVVVVGGVWYGEGVTASGVLR